MKIKKLAILLLQLGAFIFSESIGAATTYTDTTITTSADFTADAGDTYENSSGSFNAGVDIYSTPTINSFTNNGTITSTGNAGVLNQDGNVGTLINNATISTTANAASGLTIWDAGSITTLNNYGSITGANDSGGIDNAGVITNLTNYSGGLIQSGSGTGGVYGIWNEYGGVPSRRAAIGTINNAGTISGTNAGIRNESTSFTYGSTITTINNTGIINGTAANSIGIDNYRSTITSIENTAGGTISGGSTGTGIANASASAIGTITNGSGSTISGGNYGISNAASIGSIVNDGSITGSTYSIWNNTGGTISTLTNNGTIGSVSTTYGILNQGTITTFENTGTIDGGTGVFNRDTINTLTNTGVITGGVTNFSGASIATLNNAQGGSGLVYTGQLPAAYNIIINSLSSYGKLDGVTGGASAPATTMAFGVSSSSRLAAGTYASVLTGVQRSWLSNFTGTTGNYNWTLSQQTGTSDAWDLLLASLTPIYVGPDAANTLSTVQQSAAGVATTYNVQAAALQAGLTYDCNTFDKYGLCATIGGRTSYALTAPVGNQQAGLLVVSHRPDANFRYGAFADQSVNSSMPNGIKQNNSGPMYGIFGYWNHQKDGMGLGASLTTAFSNSNLTVTRNNSLASTEAGSGNTEMSGQAIQVQGTYAVQATDRIKAIPYAGLRYYRVATGGYSEGANANVTSPLTYNGMSQEVFAAVGGVGTSVFLAEKLTGTASVGIQQNLNYKMGNYQGTSAISGLESFSVSMPSNINSMATATAGMSYAVKKNEKLGVNVLWQQQAFSATNTITALATYSIGF